MAYRMSVVLVLMLFAACGDDNGGSNTKMDAAPTGDGSNAGIDAPSGDSGGGGGGDAGVGATCGTATCLATEECCFAGGGGGGTCVAAGTCTGVAFACDGPEDCEANQVCCYGNGGASAGGSECKLATQCQINACHDDTDCGGQTTKCCAVANTQYKVCLAQCPMP